MWLEMIELLLKYVMADQPTPPNVPPPEIRPYHWFPLMRPAIKPLFPRGVR